MANDFKTNPRDSVNLCLVRFCSGITEEDVILVGHEQWYGE